MKLKFDGIAEMIVGENHSTPNWLEFCLARQGSRIASMRVAEAHAPQRTVMKNKLARFRDAVSELKEGLNDPQFMIFLGNDREGSGIADREIESGLGCLSNLAHGASLRLADNPTVPLAFPGQRDTGIGAQVYCAWTICNMIKLARNLDAVGPDNVTAQKAANLLWRACGGQMLGSKDGEREPTGWRNHFLAAREIEKSGDYRARLLALDLLIFRGLTPCERNEGYDP